MLWLCTEWNYLPVIRTNNECGEKFFHKKTSNAKYGPKLLSITFTMQLNTKIAKWWVLVCRSERQLVFKIGFEPIKVCVNRNPCGERKRGREREWEQRTQIKSFIAYKCNGYQFDFCENEEEKIEIIITSIFLTLLNGMQIGNHALLFTHTRTRTHTFMMICEWHRCSYVRIRIT